MFKEMYFVVQLHVMETNYGEDKYAWERWDVEKHEYPTIDELLGTIRWGMYDQKCRGRKPEKGKYPLHAETGELQELAVFDGRKPTSSVGNNAGAGILEQFLPVWRDVTLANWRERVGVGEGSEKIPGIFVKFLCVENNREVTTFVDFQRDEEMKWRDIFLANEEGFNILFSWISQNEREALREKKSAIIITTVVPFIDVELKHEYNDFMGMNAVATLKSSGVKFVASFKLRLEKRTDAANEIRWVF